ncbi:OmpA family protein [Tenacibaculum sp. 190524A05c]|uniref:OmpA family protein n=1 Tax=Tenacibaculum platacis TaxID=3137852 RepID=UPI0032B1D502
MSKRLMYLLGILLTISIGTYFSWKLCCSHDLDEEKQTQDEVNIEPKAYKNPTLYPFSIKDDSGNFSLNATDNFNFESSKYNFLSPVSSSLDMEIGKLKDYLTSTNNKSLSITGFYTPDEQNTSVYPNLGVARAISVKNYLNSKGIPSKIMNTYGKEQIDMIADSLKVYYGPLAFSISELKDDSEELSKLGEFIKAHPLVLYFKTGQSNISLNSEERQELADIAKYLDKVEGSSCIITGHTDNTGDATVNLGLGQKRADFTKQYLVNNGIPSDKITAISKGQTEPIADNTTEEGKAKNRRTVITIK